MASSTLESDPLLVRVTDFVKEYMSRYDASHDFNHVKRVVKLAQHIASCAPSDDPPLDLQVVTLAALLHDVADRKYISANLDATTHLSSLLTQLSIPPSQAEKIAAIIPAVSWTAEKADPAGVAATLAQHPELGPVQDADRLDAIGAVGIGRLFAYGAARTGRDLAGSVAHMDEKLVLIRGRMKTPEGRRLAEERTERLWTFRAWWVDEAGDEGLPGPAEGGRRGAGEGEGEGS